MILIKNVNLNLIKKHILLFLSSLFKLTNVQENITNKSNSFLQLRINSTKNLKT